MKNPKRMLAVVGMSLAVAGALGISAPASATAPVSKPVVNPAKPVVAPAANEAETMSSSPMRAVGWDDDYVVGYFDSQWKCNKAGWWGAKTGAWGEYYCYPARVPGYGWVWVLEVDKDSWHWDSWNGGWPQSWPYRPTYLVHSNYRIGGPYHHPFKYRHGVQYGPWSGFPAHFPRWKKPGFPGWPGGGPGGGPGGAVGGGPGGGPGNGNLAR